ncbi:degenerin-like protein unc-105 [Necator americanus]|uniref:Degenerin-like protein unc-105 n=1 Tax=Necator americanus TaxID=51031 RepID=W2T1R2_NECAM|nr:degenerin-like protein unc-105 [Necator americanus]ETN75823.1 degenerin-like protein unc-105 [Necator americanus]
MWEKIHRNSPTFRADILKFENAPFPSITLCNLNPYKKSAINQNPETKAMIDAYSKRIFTGDKSEGIAAALASHLHSRVRRHKRKPKRRKHDRRYHQALAECLCDIDPLTAERKGSCFAAYKGKISVDISLTPRSLHASRCLCQLDMVSKTLWPCFPYNTWKEKLCIECVDGTGHCPMRFYRGKEKYEAIKEQVDLCLCHKEYNHCVSNRDDGVIIEIDPNDELDSLNITARTEAQIRVKQKSTTTTTTEAPQVTQALGFENLTDEIAIVTQAQQNLMFAVGSMTPEQKEGMSHQLDEFVLKCSFNQKDCDMENDFTLYYDNTYGNCYTFNHGGASSHRAGANYGLRILLYANVSEYLPTSEAVGFRITVHDKHIVPFPDAFGYSAPTGFMSSYGVRMKQFIRLVAPHGHCKQGGEDDPNFIYKGFNYSVEVGKIQWNFGIENGIKACHRSCAQKVIMEMCKCGDPMFPIPNITGIAACHATNAEERDCLRNATLYLGELYSKEKEGVPGCYCHQPCEETNYEVTYSAARWPSGSAKVMDCNPGDFLCLEKYRKNAAMIQIFYEELNYETLQETPAYTLTSVLADLGGLTGLWIGASVVSLLEIFSLIVFASQAYVRKRKGSIASSSMSQLAVRKASRASGHAIHKPSIHRLSVQDVRSLHSNHSSRSKQSIVIEDLPSPIQEQTDDEESSSSGTEGTVASCRYLAPGEELPCLCKYDSDGNIRVMKALCPVHGFMVRRGYDYRSSRRTSKRKKETGPNGQVSDQNTPGESSTEQ